MNFYQSVFLVKNCYENIREKVGFGGNYPLILTLSDQSSNPKNIFKKIRLYILQICGVSKKSKTF